MRHWFLIPVGVVSAAGCTLLATLDDHASTQAQDASADVTVDGNAPDASEPDANEPEPDGPCATIWVAPGGSDDATGCSPARPKRTIAAAVGRAGSGGDVRLCSGAFAEPAIRIDTPIAIRGGFGCPSGAPGSAESSFTSTGAPIGGSLVFAGLGVGATTLLEQVTVVGSSDPSSTQAAVLVSDGASPTLRAVTLRGGASGASSTAIGSAGLIVEGSPEVTGSLIEGGAGHGGAKGTTVGIGSAGVVVRSGNPHFTGNDIRGGSGDVVLGGFNLAVVAIGSAGVFVAGGDFTGQRAMTGNTITGGSGTSVGTSSCTGTCIGSGGIVVTGGASEFQQDKITGGSGVASAPGATAAVGVLLYGELTSRVEKSRILGWSGTTTAAGNSPVAGAVVRNLAVGTFVNNFVSASGRTDVSGSGIVLSGSGSNTTLIANTVHVATPNAASTLKGAGGALVMAGVLRASVIRNIFAVGGSTNEDSPVVFKYVSGAQNLAAFVGNTLVGGPVYLEGSGPPTLARTIPELEAALTSASPNADVGGNYRITTSCATDGGVDDSIGGICSALSCAARASGGCLGTLVQGGFGGDQGATALDAGWRLDPAAAPCSLKTGGGDAGGAAFDDFFDASRAIPFAIGAEEIAAGACP